MPSVSTDGQRGPQRHADAVDCALDTCTAPSATRTSRTWAPSHLHARLAGTIEEEGVESVARQPDRRIPRFGDREIGEKTAPTWCVDEHGLHAVRAHGLEVACETQLAEQPRPGRVDVLRTGFVTWEACFVQEKDAVTALGKEPGRDTSRRAAPDHDNVCIELRHVSAALAVHRRHTEEGMRCDRGIEDSSLLQECLVHPGCRHGVLKGACRGGSAGCGWRRGCSPGGDEAWEAAADVIQDEAGAGEAIHLAQHLHRLSGREVVQRKRAEDDVERVLRHRHRASVADGERHPRHAGKRALRLVKDLGRAIGDSQVQRAALALGPGHEAERISPQPVARSRISTGRPLGT